MPEARAILRFVRVPPRKARAVVNLIRGQQVPQALTMLKYTPRAAAKVVEKLLRSAVANAEQKEMGDSEMMWVSQAYVDGGPTFKRFQPRAMGRAFTIHKRTSHITLVVAAPEAAPAKRRERGASAQQQAKPKAKAERAGSSKSAGKAAAAPSA
jgi:large subunit ribosomal protein L22